MILLFSVWGGHGIVGSACVRAAGAWRKKSVDRRLRWSRAVETVWVLVNQEFECVKAHERHGQGVAIWVFLLSWL